MIHRLYVAALPFLLLSFARFSFARWRQLLLFLLYDDGSPCRGDQASVDDAVTVLEPFSNLTLHQPAVLEEEVTQNSTRLLVLGVKEQRTAHAVSKLRVRTLVLAELSKLLPRLETVRFRETGRKVSLDPLDRVPLDELFSLFTLQDERGIDNIKESSPNRLPVAEDDHVLGLLLGGFFGVPTRGDHEAGQKKGQDDKGTPAHASLPTAS